MSDCFQYIGCDFGKYYFDAACEAYEKACQIASEIHNNIKRLEVSTEYTTFMRHSKYGDPEKAYKMLFMAIYDAQQIVQEPNAHHFVLDYKRLRNTISLAQKKLEKWEDED